MTQSLEPPPEKPAPESPEPGVPTSAAAREGALSKGEKLAAILLFGTILALRIVCSLHYVVDSDESQHLHVVWGWTQGMLQYRDIFDNHSPLFQMLCAPLFALFGERADIVVVMRQFMLPLFAFDLWCVYRIARNLGTKRMALWAAITAGFCPVFFLCSTEFRTDDLWVACWLACLALLTGGEFRGQRAFWAGLAMGGAFAGSMKSSLLVVSLLLAAGYVCYIGAKTDCRANWRRAGPALALAFAGMLVIPGALIGYFAARGALHEMYYCVVRHNALIGGSKLQHLLVFKRYWFLLSLIAGAFLGRLYVSKAADRRRALLQVLVALTATFYVTLLKGFWPLITDQDYLPLDPIFIVALAPVTFWAASRKPPFTYAIPALVILGEFIALLVEATPWHDDAKMFSDDLSQVLRIVRPGEYIMDGKGETIYRKRPFYFVLEGVTIELMRKGYIKDDVIESLVRTKTCVLRKRRLPEGDQAWVADNYVMDVDKLWVAGKWLGAVRPKIAFRVGIPATYTVISDSGPVAGTIDGAPISSSPFLQPGDHSLEISSGSGTVALVWSKAVERGFNLFDRQHHAAE